MPRCFPILVSFKEAVDSNQVSTMVCTGFWGFFLYASIMKLFKIVLLVTEIKDLNPGSAVEKLEC